MDIMRTVSTLISWFRPLVQFWSDSFICPHLPSIVLFSCVFQHVKTPVSYEAREIRGCCSRPTVEVKAASSLVPQRYLSHCHTGVQESLVGSSLNI